MHPLVPVVALLAAAPAADPLAAVKTRADLDAVIAANPKLKAALTDHAAAVLAAAARKPHAEAVAAVLEKARGTGEKANDTPEPLAAALGGPSPLFDTLKAVNLADSALGVKAKRDVDPFDAAFYDHLGHLAGLESLTILHTTAQNDWLIPVGKLKSLKTLRIINQSKLNDEGLAHLAGLTGLENFGYIGTSMTGAPIKDFKGWTNLKSASFRGSKMSDAGLEAICESFPNLQSLVLAHGQYTDAAAAKVAKLTQLKGLEIGSTKATPACLKPLTGLPLEYLQLGDGLDASSGIAVLPAFKTMKRLTLTNCKNTTDDDLALVAGMKSLEHLELSGLDLPDARVAVLKPFGFLKSARILRPVNPDAEGVKAKIKAALPGVDIKFE